MFILHRFESFTLPSFFRGILLRLSYICNLFRFPFCEHSLSECVCAEHRHRGPLSEECRRHEKSNPALGTWEYRADDGDATGETKEYIQRDCLLVECVLPINYSSCVRQPGKCLCYGILSTRNVFLGRREIVPINLIRSELPRRWDQNPILAEI